MSATGEDAALVAYLVRTFGQSEEDARETLRLMRSDDPADIYAMGEALAPMLARMAEHGIDGILDDDEREALSADLARLAKQRQDVEVASRDAPVGARHFGGSDR